MRSIDFFLVTVRISIVTTWVFLVTSSLHADLIAYYPFEGDSTDVTGNGYDGIDAGDAGPAGAATGFDGVGEAYEFLGQGHVIIPLDINPVEYPQLTVTMWVKPDQQIVDAPGLYKTFGHDDGGWDRTFGLDNRNGEYRYAAFNGAGITQTTGTDVTADWTFLAAVWDSDAGPTVRFHANDAYIEEALVDTASGHFDSAIGNLRPDNFNEGWQGLIDDVRIYDDALSIKQIDDIREPVVTLTAILTEDQETHDTNGVPNTAAGTATVTYTKATGDLDWDIQWNDLSGSATAMHFHGPAAAGTPAGVQFDIGGNSGLTSPSAGMGTITAAQAADMLDGLWYVNIHTAANGQGEIRGQLQQVRDSNWTGGVAGLWQDNNWSRVPSNNANVRINPAGDASVLGPLVDTLVYSLSVASSGDGIGELRLQPGVGFSTLGGLTVGAKGRLVGAGTLSGPLSVESQGELVVLAGETFQAMGTIRPISGVITSMGNLTFDRSVTNMSEGTINAISSTLSFPGNGAKDDVGLTNQGTLNLTRTIVNGDVHSPSGSTINVGVDVTFNGLVSGAANFPGAGSVTFNGGFDPGDSPAKMLFGGDVTFGGDNTLRIELGGRVAGDEYDQVNVMGEVDLGGKLLIELMDGFEPGFGDEFVLMNYGSRGEGWFEQVVLPPGEWHLLANDQQISLLAVPEPSGLLLLLMSLPLIHLMRRRRMMPLADALSIGPIRTVGFGRLVLLAAMCLMSASSLRADLIAYYPFDEDSSDQSGNGNDGIDQGDARPAGPNSGLFGGAYEFGGAGHVVIPIDINPDIIEDLSVTMWVRPDDSIVNASGLYKTFGHDDGGWDRTFGLDNRQNGVFRYAAFTGGSLPGPTPDTGTPVTTDWTFLAAVWSSDDLTITFYANDNSIEEDLAETFSVHTESAIGNLRPDNFSEGWVGLIDEVQIFDEILLPEDIEALYQLGQSDEREFINPDGGLWDLGGNWTGVGTPDIQSRVTIDPDNGAIVVGPSNDATVRWLKLSANSGVAELRLTGERTFTTTEAEGLEIGDRGRLIANGTINGGLKVGTGGELLVMSGDTLRVADAPAAVAGTINVLGALTFDQSLTNSTAGRINAVGGTLNFPGNSAKDAVGLTNEGQLDLTNSIVNGDVHSPVNSTINVVQSAEFNGLVSGAANFPGAGEVRLNGGYQPGDSAALVQFAGDVSFGNNNSLLMEIGGLQAGIQHDKLEIAGDVSLAGELRIELIDGFTPADGNQFTLMTYNSRNNTVFDSVVFPSAAWSITYGNQALLVSIGDGVLPGDYNSDGVLDVLDIDLQAAEMKKPVAEQDLAKFDHNGDGVIDVGQAGTDQSKWGDRLIWIRNLRGTAVGDTNMDGLFDSGDLVLALQGTKYGNGEMATWVQGDWNGDMFFDSGDLVLAFQDGQYVAAAAPAVPEPSSLVLTLLSVLSLIGIARPRAARFAA